MPLLQDQNEKAIREQQKLSLWSTDCEEEEGERDRERGTVAPLLPDLVWTVTNEVED